MRSFEQIRTVAAARLAAESGMAVPVVLAALVIGLSLGSAAVLASVQVQSGSIRDEDSKAAIAAADAAVAEAVFRQNKVPTAGGNRCLVLGAGATLIPGPPAADGWCPAVSGTVGTASWTYRVRHLSPVNGTETMEVVGTGTSDGVSRRVEVQARTENGGNPFSTQRGRRPGLHHHELERPNHGQRRHQRRHHAERQRQAVRNGPARHRARRYAQSRRGSSSHGGSGCPQSTYPVVKADTTLAPVFQGFVPSVNSNGRFFSQDLKGPTDPGSVTWSSSTRTLSLDAGGSVTLGGNNYSFCRLQMNSNSTIYIAAGAEVRIYFDTPEACNQSSGVTQLQMDSNTRIISSSGNPANAALLFVGSSSRTTRANLNSNSGGGGATCESSFVLYGPLTEVTMNSNSTWCGAIAGKSVHMDSNVRINASGPASGFPLPAALLYRGVRYVECVGAATTAPDQGC